MQAAYNELLEAVQKGNEKAIEKAVEVAVNEKSRYVAERITRTEMARAWADGFIAKIKDDDDVVAVKFKLSSRHPVFDICDMYAKADMYGLGAGIYPKDKLLPLPVHPHCLCRYVEVIEGEVDMQQQRDQVREAGDKWLNSLPESRRAQVLGRKGLKAWEDGKDWRKYMRGYAGLREAESRLQNAQLYKIPELGTDIINDEYHSSKNIIRKFDIREVCNSRYNMMVSTHVNLKPRMLDDIENQLDQAVKVLKINKLEILPQIIIVNHYDIVGALGAYIAVDNRLYLNTDIFNKKANLEFMQNCKGELSRYGNTTIVHELIHWMDAKKHEKRYGKIIDQKSYVLAIRRMHKVNVDKLKAKGYNISEISSYAKESDSLGQYEEVMTEYRSLLYLKEGGS